MNTETVSFQGIDYLKSLWRTTDNITDTWKRERTLALIWALMKIKAKTISEIHSEAEKNLGLCPGAASVIRNGRSSPGGPLSPGGGFPMNRPGTRGMMPGMPGSRKMPGMPGLD
ncbi:hypothetical protein ACJX0J_021485, partial [Zea mays]